MPDEIVIKINSIGSYRVGKTSLIRRYAERKFSSDYLPTLGVDVTVKRINLDNEQIRLVLMDTAGQEQFGRLRNTYYQGSLGCIAVYDVTRRESFEDLNQWIDNYRNVTSKDASIVIVGNKIDLTDLRTVSTKEGKNYCKKNGFPFYESSAKIGGEEIPEMYNRLVRMILKRIDV
ncbi:MAG: Rab family GTPase [Candidatus Hodarchaeales archaeon]|jgi:small GTP-binding protein